MTDEAPAGGAVPGSPGPNPHLRPGVPARYPAGPGGPYPLAAPAAFPAAVRPPRDAGHPPRRVDPLPGTPFGLVHLQVAPVFSGPAVGSLVAGIASILLSVLVFCFGAAGANEGWGVWAAVAFAILTTLVGAGGVVVGLFARRQIAPGAAATGGALHRAGRGPERGCLRRDRDGAGAGGTRAGTAARPRLSGSGGAAARGRAAGGGHGQPLHWGTGVARRGFVSRPAGAGCANIVPGPRFDVRARGG